MAPGAIAASVAAIGAFVLSHLAWDWAELRWGWRSRDNTPGLLAFSGCVVGLFTLAASLAAAILVNHP